MKFSKPAFMHKVMSVYLDSGSVPEEDVERVTALGHHFAAGERYWIAPKNLTVIADALRFYSSYLMDTVCSVDDGIRKSKIAKECSKLADDVALVLAEEEAKAHEETGND